MTCDCHLLDVMLALTTICDFEPIPQCAFSIGLQRCTSLATAIHPSVRRQSLPVLLWTGFVGCAGRYRMVLVEDDLASVTNVKKRMLHGEDIFLRARDFYHAHEDMRGEAIVVIDGSGKPWYALRFQTNRLDYPRVQMLLPTYVNPYWNYAEDAERMDFTYLESHDLFVFERVEEYSCFMARLIARRYPAKTVCFMDERARWFLDDPELVAGLDEALERHPEVDRSRALLVESHMCIGPMLSNTTHALSLALMASVFWASDMTSFGEQNPDTYFYLIKPEVGESGLAKLIAFTVGFYDMALKKTEDIDTRIVPVVDTGIPGDKNQFNGGDGRDVWTMFFEPLGTHSLEEVYDSKNVIVSQEGNVSVNPYLLALKRNPNVPELIRRHVRLNRACEDYCEEVRKQVLGEGSGRVLGVVGRGTDFNNPTITRFRQRPLTPEELLGKVADAVQAHGFDRVFLATEDARVFAAFMASELRDKVLFVPQPRFDLSSEEDRHKLLVDVYQEQEKAGGRDGYVETLRYLSILYILSTCDALIGSTVCGATIFAEGYKRGVFEFSDVFGSQQG